MAAAVCAGLGLWMWQATATRDFFLPAAAVGILVVVGCRLSGWHWKRWAPALLAAFIAVLIWRVRQVAPFNFYVERTREEAAAKGISGEIGVAWRLEGPGQVWKVLRPLLQKNPNLEVWFAGSAWVDGNTVAWEATREGLPIKMFTGAEKTNRDANGIPKNTDVLVLAESQQLGLIEYPIPGATVGLWQQWVRGELAKTWQEVGWVEDPAGKKTMVLQRIIQ